MSIFPSNSPYLTEYSTMTPFASSDSLQLTLTLLSDITLYVRVDTGPGTEEVGRKWGVNNCGVQWTLIRMYYIQIKVY